MSIYRTTQGSAGSAELESAEGIIPAVPPDDPVEPGGIDEDWELVGSAALPASNIRGATLFWFWRLR